MFESVVYKMVAILPWPQCVKNHISQWIVILHKVEWVRWSTLYSVAAPVMTISFLWAITEIGHHPSTLHRETNSQDVLIAPFRIVETVSLNCNVQPLTQQVTNLYIARYSNANKTCLHCMSWINLPISWPVQKDFNKSHRLRSHWS